MTTHLPSSLALSLLWAGLSLPVFAADGVPIAGDKPDAAEAASDATKPNLPALSPFVLPASTSASVLTNKTRETGVDWFGLTGASLRFLAIEHSFRLLTEPGTREGLKGPYLRNYGRAVGNLHGWADGDEFYVNYVGHPMEGAVAGFLFVGSDRSYRRAEFGTSSEYWKSRLRAAAFAWAFSTQFEIGPASEASVGAIQAAFPQQGFADHVITPSIGLAWMIGEDAIDKYIIKRIEGATTNPYLRFAARGGLNPARSFANVLQGRLPWNRETRPGVKSFMPGDERAYTAAMKRATEREASEADYGVVAPFEFALTFQPQRLLGGKDNPSCLGGGGSAGFRLASSLQLIVDVGGCKMTGLEKDLSGDSLTYMAGPRWSSRIRGPWSAYLQILGGGNKITEERMYPERKQLLEKAALGHNSKVPVVHDDYTDATESNGFALSTGGGVNYNLRPSLTLRVAELSYRHAWTSPLWGRDYTGGLQWSSGIVLRMGTW